MAIPAVSPRQKLQLLTVLTTPYTYQFRQIEDILAIINAEPTDETRIAVLKDAIAFYGLPDAPDRLINRSKPSAVRQEYTVARDTIKLMVTRGNIDCCAAFKNKNALDAAREVYRQMCLAEQCVGQGSLGAAMWLEAILRNPSHVPYTDVQHVFPSFQKDGTAATIIANPELYAEFVTLLRTADTSVVVRWILAVPCTNETREALLLYAFSWIANMLARRSVSTDITDLLGAIMASRGSPDPTAN